MKISTKGRYAIEAMVDLAMHSNDRVESIKNIAERRNLSEKYLEQIVGALRRAGLISSTRGAAGGYSLNKCPEDITVLEILEATERNLVPLDCLHKTSDCGINCDKCATRQMWNNMWLNIKHVLEGVTLADIMEQSQEVQNETIEYYI